MAKKTRKVLKQESQQRAIQQAATNVNTALTAAAAQSVVTDKVCCRAARGEIGREYRRRRFPLRQIGPAPHRFAGGIVHGDPGGLVLLHQVIA